jgi:hypothetical protein
MATSRRGASVTEELVDRALALSAADIPAAVRSRCEDLVIDVGGLIEERLGVCWTLNEIDDVATIAAIATPMAPV